MNEFISKLKTRLKKAPKLFSLLKPFKKTLIDNPKEFKRNYLFKKNGKVVLEKFSQAMEATNVPFWLAFGTLLGAVREKGFIKHDYDMDVGIFAEDYSEELEEKLKAYGFKKIREFLIDDGQFGREQTFEYKSVTIDVFYFKRNIDKYCCYLFTKIKENGQTSDELGENEYIVREVSYPFIGFKKLTFLGKEYNIPENAIEHLVMDYGQNYMTPDPDYTAGSRNNVRYLENVKGIFRRGQS